MFLDFTTPSSSADLFSVINLNFNINFLHILKFWNSLTNFFCLFASEICDPYRTGTTNL